MPVRALCNVRAILMRPENSGLFCMLMIMVSCRILGCGRSRLTADRNSEGGRPLIMN